MNNRWRRLKFMNFCVKFKCQDFKNVNEGQSLHRYVLDFVNESILQLYFSLNECVYDFHENNNLNTEKVYLAPNEKSEKEKRKKKYDLCIFETNLSFSRLNMLRKMYAFKGYKKRSEFFEKNQ